MKIWMAALLVIFLIPIVAVANGYANHSDSEHSDHQNPGKGTISFTQTGIVKGPAKHEHTTIVVVKERLTFTGNLTGSALTIERDVMHNVTRDGKTVIFTTFHGSGNYTGSLGNNSVKLHIRYEGVKNSTFARGNFVVSGDTGQSADVHGEGHFRGSLGNVEGTGSAVNYTVHWTVQTQSEHPEAKDKDRDTD